MVDDRIVAQNINLYATIGGTKRNQGDQRMSVRRVFTGMGIMLIPFVITAERFVWILGKSAKHTGVSVEILSVAALLVLLFLGEWGRSKVLPVTRLFIGWGILALGLYGHKWLAELQPGTEHIMFVFAFQIWLIMAYARKDKPFEQPKGFR